MIADLIDSTDFADATAKTSAPIYDSIYLLAPHALRWSGFGNDFTEGDTYL